MVVSLRFFEEGGKEGDCGGVWKGAEERTDNFNVYKVVGGELR